MQLEYTGYNIQPVTQEERLNEIHCSVWRVRMVTHTHIRWAVGGYEVAHSILSADLCMVTNIQWRTVTTASSDLYKVCSKKRPNFCYEDFIANFAPFQAMSPSK
jgi:hypothetical protein